MTETCPTHLEHQATALTELADVASQSAAFYRDAAAVTKDPQLKTLYTKMAVSKKTLAASMTKAIPDIDVNAGSGAGTRTVDRLRTLCSELRDKRSGRSDAYADHVKEIESSQLKAFLSVMDRDIPMPVKNVVRRYLRAIHQHQDVVERGPWSARLA